MVVLKGPVSRGTVQRFKGKLDFYQVHGQWRVRKWPVNIRTSFSAGETLAQCFLTEATHLYSQSSDMLRTEYGCSTQHSWWNRRDYFMVNYFGTIDPWLAIAYGHHPPQPTPCPRGTFHYFSLLRAWSAATAGLQFHTFFQFDGPGTYVLFWTRTRPTMSHVPAPEHPGQFLGWNVDRNNHTWADVQLTPHGPPNIYRRPFIGGGGDLGDWWFFIMIRNPTTGHMGLSLTPLMHVTVPDLVPPHPAHLTSGPHIVVANADPCPITKDQIETPPS